MPGLQSIKSFVKRNLLIVQVGLLTGLASVLFETINLLVIYRQVKMDYYISLVAVLFLAVGIIISKRMQQPAPAPKQSPALLLTTRELEVLSLIAAGKTNKEIAAAHFVEISTVKTHVNNIYTKLGVTNRREAQAKYAQITSGEANT